MQVEDVTRARVSRLLLSPPAEDTDQLLRMAQDCLDRNRLKRTQAELKALQEHMSTLSGTDKTDALKRVMALSEQIARLSAHRP